MNTIPSPADREAVRQVLAVNLLAGLLTMGLPLAEWSIFSTVYADGFPRLYGHLSAAGNPAASRADIISWARALGVQLTERPGHREDLTCWMLAAVRQGVMIELYVMLPSEFSAAHPMPSTVPPVVDQFVRRTPVRRTTGGEFAGTAAAR